MWARIHVVHEQAHTRISIRILGNKLAVVALGGTANNSSNTSSPTIVVFCQSVEKDFD